MGSRIIIIKNIQRLTLLSTGKRHCILHCFPPPPITTLQDSVLFLDDLLCLSQGMPSVSPPGLIKIWVVWRNISVKRLGNQDFSDCCFKRFSNEDWSGMTNDQKLKNYRIIPQRTCTCRSHVIKKFFFFNQIKKNCQAGGNWPSWPGMANKWNFIFGLSIWNNHNFLLVQRKTIPTDLF